MSVQIVNAGNFENVTASGVSVVDFWAEWCGPCQMMLPILDQFAAANASVTVGKINVDEEPALAQKFRVMSIPTIIVFKDGKAVEQMVGVKQQAELEAVVAKYA
jgi:thioredoxin 1